ncbi:hypothetical protein D3C84_1295360 [compost metagenome]
MVVGRIDRFSTNLALAALTVEQAGKCQLDKGTLAFPAHRRERAIIALGQLLKVLWMRFVA